MSRIVIATVKHVAVEASGHYVDVEVEPDGTPLSCRVASPHPGMYVPIPSGAEVVVLIPDRGEPICQGRLRSTADPTPPEAVSDPSRVWIRSPGAIGLLTSGVVEIGATPLDVTRGVVRACDTCAWGGVHPKASATVRAKD